MAVNHLQSASVNSPLGTASPNRAGRSCCEHRRNDTFLCLDGWRRWVLHAVRIRSENAAKMRPATESTLGVFGQPVACMRDLGSAIAKAFASCLQPGSAELVCHFHFLAAAIGRKLLDADHSALNRALTQLRIRSGLRSLLRPLRAQAFPFRPPSPRLWPCFPT